MARPSLQACCVAPITSHFRPRIEPCTENDMYWNGSFVPKMTCTELYLLHPLTVTVTISLTHFDLKLDHVPKTIHTEMDLDMYWIGLCTEMDLLYGKRRNEIGLYRKWHVPNWIYPNPNQSLIVIGRSHMTIGMTTGLQTGRHTDRRYRSHRATGVQTGVPTDRRYVYTWRSVWRPVCIPVCKPGARFSKLLRKILGKS